MKILYIPSLNLPVVYWRIENYAQTMVKVDKNTIIHVEYLMDGNSNLSWEHACLQNTELAHTIQEKLVAAFDHFDIIIFQKLQWQESVALIEEIKKDHPDVITVAEVDDSIMGHSPSSNRNWKDHHRWAAEHLLRSDAVITSTEYLKDEVRAIVGPDKPVHVAPNCIHIPSWQIRKDKKHTHDDIRIGYVGGGAHDEDLLLIYHAMLPILDKEDAVRLIIRYGGFRPSFLEDHPQIEFKRVDWHISKYQQHLYDLHLDLALAPLRDTEFNRCKSNLKWLEWSSLDVPLIASNVEPYKNTNGTIILSNNSINEWTETIQRFLDDSLSDDHNLKKQCRINYNMNSEARKVLTFLKELV